MAQVPLRVCAEGGGIPTASGKSSTGVICDGGTHNGKEVIMVLVGKGPLTPVEIQKEIDHQMKDLGLKK